MPSIDLIGMGDSLTWGYPFGPEASWLDLAARETGLKVLNRGVSGETTGEMLARFDRDVVRLKPRVVTIMGGTNDAWAGFSVAEVGGNIRAMVDRALQAGIYPVICLPPPLCYSAADISLFFLEKMASHLKAYREDYQELASSRGLMLVDFYTPLLDPATGWGLKVYFVDDAHPSREGYRVMAGVAIGMWRQIGQVIPRFPGK